MSPRAASLALSLLFLGCATSTRDLVREGEERLGGGEPRVAQHSFAAALRDPGLSGLLLTRAQVGEAKAFLALADLVTAESRLRRISPQVSARWYHLAEIAERRGDPNEASRCYEKALDRGHGGDTARRLARVVAGEARSPDPLVAAARYLEQGGHEEVLGALRVAERTWRESLAGVEPQQLLGRLEPASRLLPAYASVQLLRVSLLERLGRASGDDWALAAVSPPPSPEFRAHAAATRVWLLARARDEGALAQALASCEDRVALELAAQLAAARLRRGDQDGAIRILQLANRGSAGGQARARAARLQALLGDPEASAVWASVPDDPTEPELALLIGARRLREGDAFGAAPLLLSSGSPLATRAAAFVKLTQTATWALASGDQQLAQRAADAACLLASADPTLARLLNAASSTTPWEPLASAAADTAFPQAGRGALSAVACRLLLRAGRLDAARELGAGSPSVVREEAQGAVRQAMVGGRAEEVARFLIWAPLARDEKAALLADVGLAGLGSRPPAGRAEGLPHGEHQGSIELESGLQLGSVRVSLDEVRFVLESGGRGRISSVADLERLWGASLGQVRWRQGETEPAPAQPAFRVTPVLEVE